MTREMGEKTTHSLSPLHFLSTYYVPSTFFKKHIWMIKSWGKPKYCPMKFMVRCKKESSTGCGRMVQKCKKRIEVEQRCPKETEVNVERCWGWHGGATVWIYLWTTCLWTVLSVCKPAQPTAGDFNILCGDESKWAKPVGEFPQERGFRDPPQVLQRNLSSTPTDMTDCSFPLPHYHFSKIHKK